MVQIELNNGEILEVSNSIIENIIPIENINESEIIPLFFVNPDDFILFVNNYHNIKEGVSFPFNENIKFANIAIALQQYEILDLITDNIIEGFSNTEYINSIKSYKNEVISALADLNPDISNDILEKLRSYQIYNANISDASLDLLVTIERVFTDDNKTKILEYYRDKLISENTLNYKLNSYARLIGIDSKYEVSISPNPNKPIIMSRDGTKYGKYITGRNRDSRIDLHYKDGKLIRSGIYGEYYEFSPNFNYRVYYESDSRREFKLTDLNTMGTKNINLNGSDLILDLPRSRGSSRNFRKIPESYYFSANEKYLLLQPRSHTLSYVVDTNTAQVISYGPIANSVVGDTGIFMANRNNSTERYGVSFIPFINDRGEYTNLDINNARLIYDDSDIIVKGISLINGSYDSIGLNIKYQTQENDNIDRSKFIALRYTTIKGNTLVEFVNDLL